MYRLIVDQGVVLDEFGVQVAPCQSADDPAFVAYIQWVEAGNEPEIVSVQE
jgi:cytochrome c